jgi:hypothetical protein
MVDTVLLLAFVVVIVVWWVLSNRRTRAIYLAALTPEERAKERAEEEAKRTEKELLDRQQDGQMMAEMTEASDFVLVRSDKGDRSWSLYAPNSTDEQIASGQARPLVSGNANWSNLLGAWDSPHSGDFAIAHIKTARNLSHLLEDLRMFADALGPDEDCENALKAHGIDICDLPKFGGEQPHRSLEVWSWDDTHVLVGIGPFTEWRITTRGEWEKWSMIARRKEGR